MMNIGLKRMISMLLCLGLSGFNAAQAMVSAIDPAVDRLEKRLTDWENLQGSFQQKIYGDTEELIESTTGTVHLKKTGKLRWEVTNARDKSLIVSDGKHIWHYDPELQQATIDAFDPKGTSPLMFLTTKTQRLGKNFMVKEVSGPLCNEQADACFEMTPRSQDDMFQWIRIGFSKGALLGLEFLDQLGQHGWISFSKMKVNKPMSDDLFHFTPPKGTDMVRRS
jgi:outer membrane lipoprotein carrier protein